MSLIDAAEGRVLQRLEGGESSRALCPESAST